MKIWLQRKNPSPKRPWTASVRSSRMPDTNWRCSKNTPTIGQLLEAVADVDALIVRSDKVTAEVIAAARNLKIVVRAGAGYDNVDLAAASARASW